MSDSQENIDFNRLRKTISAWLESRLDQKNYQWIGEKSERLKDTQEDWEFFSAFSLVPRYAGKERLNVSDNEKQQAEDLRHGWKPEFWTRDELARALLVLSITTASKKTFLDKLEKVFISSDTAEATALYKSLPILPYPHDLQERAAEGIRSNITTIFNAVALRNPYPAEYMDDAAWNQLVLKALFVESPLYPIQGVDSRSNEKLAHMLVDYAHERWAAGRDVSPELWRPVGPFVVKQNLPDLKKVLNHPDKINQQAALLALMESSFVGAKQLIENHREEINEIKQNNITWNSIGKRFNSDKNLAART